MSPMTACLLSSICLLKRTKTMAPDAPARMPKILRSVTFSFIRMAATKRTNMGRVVIMREAFMAPVRSSPLKNNNWLMATPNNPQAASRRRSLRSTFSLLKKGLTMIKRVVAPRTRSKMNPMGWM